LVTLHVVYKMKKSFQ